MIRRIFCTALLTLLLISAAGCANNTGSEANTSGRLNVCASFYPMFDFAKKVGGDKANVTVLVPAGTEPHDWEPSTSDMMELEKADVFIYNGAGMETWAQDILASLGNKSLTAVEASKGITLLGGNATDPHVWLDPKLAKAEMENIKNAFAAADPVNASYYEDNYKTYAAKFDALDADMRAVISACPKKDIVVAHQAFSYLCSAYGLNQIAIEGVAAESEPDPARMAQIVNFVKANGVKVIFFEELISPKVAQSIADESGARVAVLNPLEGLSGNAVAAGEDYISVMRKNLDELKKALE